MRLNIDKCIMYMIYRNAVTDSVSYETGKTTAKCLLGEYADNKDTILNALCVLQD